MVRWHAGGMTKLYLVHALIRLLIKYYLFPVLLRLLLFSHLFLHIPYWFVLLILIKESIILIGSLFLLITRSGFTVQPTLLGKATTVVQVSFIMWLFFCYFFNWVPTKTYYSMIGIMVSFILLSFAQYVYIGLRYLVYMVVKL